MLDVNVSMVRPNSIDAAMPLHKPHRVPWQIDADDATSLLEVDPFGQYICSEEHVVEIFR